MSYVLLSLISIKCRNFAVRVGSGYYVPQLVVPSTEFLHMLIEFSVANFRSFRERQTFQMTAAPRLGKKENTFHSGVEGEKLPSLLKVAAIYGGNASGKTSLIKAFAVIYRLVNWKPQVEARKLPVSPFRFDVDLLDKPSVFEMHFIAEGVRYQYKIAATSERIVEEVLYSYPRGKELLLYERRYDGDVETYKFGDAFEGDDVLRSAWRRLTGPQSLFISQAVVNSSEDLVQLRIPFEWLSNGVHVIDSGLDRWADVGRRLPSDEKFAIVLSKFLKDVDVPVTEIHFEPTSGVKNWSDSLDSIDSDELKKVFQTKGKTTLTHKTRLGEAKFDFSEESKGTQNLIGMFLPWILLKASAENGNKNKVLIIDELDSSLHPEIVEHLVDEHIKSGSTAQLIFSTHDTHLMSSKLLRRDQIWVVDRNSAGATRLKSIHSVKGREGEDVERRYFEGRYRGLPVRRRS
ncbi:ATP-binding protein [Burkholderia sp. A1]|uniref:AAA family ATPase n=1 Tax=Burkholderia sp. A1 TaxID=148446 RepID=UPI001F5A5FCB|nr:ATP-binding protein [Burkholderia sp. A1]